MNVSKLTHYLISCGFYFVSFEGSAWQRRAWGDKEGKGVSLHFPPGTPSHRRLLRIVFCDRSATAYKLLETTGETSQF